MSEADTGAGGSKGGPKRPPGRRPKPPVTIDLTAGPASADSSSPADETGTPDPARGEAAAAREIPAVSETPAAVPAEAPRPARDPAGDKPDAADPPPAAGSKADTSPANRAPVGGADDSRASEPPQRPASAVPPRGERPKTDWSSAGLLLAAGVLGGAIATVLGILYHASGIIPTRADLTAADAVRQVQAVSEKVAGFEGRLAALETATSGLSALTEKVTALEKLEDTNRSRIENLENAMPAAGSGGDGGVALGPIEARLAAAEGTLTTLGDRIGALTGRVEEIAARPPPAVESERAARAIAIGLLRQGAGSGQGFAADLAMLKALGLDGEAVAALEPLATNGAPTVATLQAAFPGVADAILAASSELPPDAGFIDRFLSFGSGLVTVRPVGPIEGDTPDAVVSRMQAAVSRGDLATALEERGKLPPAGQNASATWAAAAADRTAIDSIVEQLALSVTPPAN
jgi:hypothetical protein